MTFVTLQFSGLEWTKFWEEIAPKNKTRQHKNTYVPIRNMEKVYYTINMIFLAMKKIMIKNRIWYWLKRGKNCIFIIFRYFYKLLTVLFVIFINWLQFFKWFVLNSSVFFLSPLLGKWKTMHFFRKIPKIRFISVTTFLHCFGQNSVKFTLIC